MQQYLYTVRPTRPDMLVAGPTESERKATSDHFAYLKELAAQGVVFLAGRTQSTDPDGLGIIIFRADTPQEAKALVDRDPAVEAGVFQARLYPYRVALLADAPQQAPWKP